MTNSQKPDRRLQTSESQKQQSAGNRETSRPADSVPVVAGQFAQLPATFGRYQIEKLLGRGTMGSVYLARDTQLDRLVAIKIPKVAASGSRRLLLRLETEAKAAAQLDHPSLCKVYDAGAVDGQCFIAMQYIEGDTLKSQLETRDKSDAEAVSLIVQLAEGLADAHALGIVHRDLKPENIMINRRGVPVVMDFGLAKFATISGNAAATQAGTIIGSPAYMSPEQANGNLKEIDQRSDIYSLGTMLFEMLTGDWPFNGTALQILGLKSLLDPSSPLTLRPDLHPQLAAVCHKMIARSSSNRYQMMSEVIADLKAIDLSAATLRSEVVTPRPTQQSRGIKDPDTLNSLDAQMAFLSGCNARTDAAKGQQTSQKLVANLQRVWDGWRGLTPFVTRIALGSLGAVVLALGIIVLFSTPYGTVQIDIHDPQLSVRFDGKSITVDNDGQMIRVSPTAAHRLEVRQNGIAVESLTGEVTLKNRESRLITVKLLKGTIVVDDGVTKRQTPEKAEDSVIPDKPQAPPVAESAPQTDEAEKAVANERLPAGTVQNWKRTYRNGAYSPNSVTVLNVNEPAIDRHGKTNRAGQWSIEGDELVQSQLTRANLVLAFGNPEWKDYDYTFEARMTGGSHGFKAIYHFTEDRSYSEFAVGNYFNTFHDVSSWRQGQWKRADGMAKPGVVQQNRWYTARLEVRGAKVACYLDGELIFNSDDPASVSGRCGVSMFDAQARFRSFKVTRPDGTVLWSGLPDLSEINSP